MSTTRLFDLSDDLLLHILGHACIEVVDRVAFLHVSRRARAIASHSTLWQDVTVPALRLAPRSWNDSDSTSEESDGSDNERFLYHTSGSSLRKKSRRKRRRTALDKATPEGEKSLRCSAAVAIDCLSKLAGSELQALDLSALAPSRSRPGHLAVRDLRVLGLRCPSLEAFACPPTDVLTSESLLEFARMCFRLRTLTLRRVTCLTVPRLGQVLRALPDISHLSLVDCPNVRGQAKSMWDALRCISSTLVRLDISETPLSTLPLREMGAHCLKLEELLTDRCLHLKFPSRMLPQSAKFSSLRIFRGDFTDCGVESGPFFLRALLERASLRALSLNVHTSRLDLSLFQRYPHGISRLEHLALSGQNVSDAWWAEVVLTHLSQTLRTLDVSKSSSLTGSTMLDSDRLPLLEKVDLSATRFSEAALRILVLHVAPRLTVLKVAACRSIRNRELRRDALSAIRE